MFLLFPLGSRKMIVFSDNVVPRQLKVPKCEIFDNSDLMIFTP
jgi:hypothetical protein